MTQNTFTIHLIYANNLHNQILVVTLYIIFGVTYGLPSTANVNAVTNILFKTIELVD